MRRAGKIGSVATRSGGDAPSADLAPERQQLERVLASVTFRQVDRLKRFLASSSSRRSQGRGDQLKEYVIGVQVFDKDSSFDPRADPIVRVQARRLRARLVRYYREEGAHRRDRHRAAERRLRAGLQEARGAVAGPAIDRRDAGRARTRIAVLPFADHSPAQELGLLLRRPAPGDHPPAGEARRRCGCSPCRPGRRRAVDARDDYAGQVAMLLTGGVRKSGDRVRVTVHLVDSADRRRTCGPSRSTRRWATSSPRRSRWPTPWCASSSRGCSTPASAAARAAPAENLAARNLYLQGRYHLNQRTDEGLQKALEFFEKAIVEDAQFALAHSGLADAHSLLAHYGVRGSRPGVGARRRRARRRRSCSTAIRPRRARRWRTSRRRRTGTGAAPSASSRQAIGLDPRYATGAPLVRDVVPGADGPPRRGAGGDAHRAVARSGVVDRRARPRDDPRLPPRLRSRARAVRPHDRAEPALLAGLLGAGHDPGTAQGLDEAIAAFQRAIDLSPNSPRMHAALGRALALSGRNAGARPSLRKLETMARQRYVSPFEFAVVRFALGPARGGVPLADQGLRRPRLRRARAEGRSAIPAAQGRPAAARDRQGHRIAVTLLRGRPRLGRPAARPDGQGVNRSAFPVSQGCACVAC